jgi:hypothetical protein
MCADKTLLPFFTSLYSHPGTTPSMPTMPRCAQRVRLLVAVRDDEYLPATRVGDARVVK